MFVTCYNTINDFQQVSEMNAALTLYTIGHSNLTRDDFLAHLRQHGITVLVDVRTVLRVTGYRFIIFTNDHLPPHVHAKQAEGGAKINLNPIEITEHFKLNQRQLREIEEIVQEYQDYWVEQWREIQGGEE
jgi:uncharacterized membrane protein YcaP (DUF421 family)